MEGVVTLKKQDIEEDIIIDSLTINLVGSSIKGKVNEANTAAKFDINLDSDRKWFLLEIHITHQLLIKNWWN